MQPTTFRAKYTVFLTTIAKWVFWGLVIGALTGTTSAFLLKMIKFLTEIHKGYPWLLFLLPLGGVVIGFLYQHGKDSDKGNNLVYDDINSQGKIRLRMGPIAFIGTFITHLLGGSTGREGAAIQMAGSIAKGVGRFLKVPADDEKIVLLSGIAGGFGSAFGTPLTGAVFAMEVTALGKMRFEALVPCVVASLAGYFVTNAWGAEHDHFAIKKVPELTALTLGKVVVAAILFGLISILYSQIRHELQEISEKYIKNYMLRRAVGGLLIIGLVFLIGGSTDYTGRGLVMAEQAFKESVPPLAFFWKAIFTAVTMGSGFVGGEAIPLFFMGATFGNVLSGQMDLPLSFLAAMGMIGVFCGAANTPIAAFMLGMEMFEGKALKYFFLVCIIAYVVSGSHGIWPAQKLYPPKSRLLSLPEGETLAAIRKAKKRHNAPVGNG